MMKKTFLIVSLFVSASVFAAAAPQVPPVATTSFLTTAWNSTTSFAKNYPFALVAFLVNTNNVNQPVLPFTGSFVPGVFNPGAVEFAKVDKTQFVAGWYDRVARVVLAKIIFDAANNKLNPSVDDTDEDDSF